MSLDGQNTDYIPCFWSGAQPVSSSAIKNIPEFGQKEGYDWFGVYWTTSEDLSGMYTPTAGQKRVLTDITKWREQVTFPDLERVDWKSCAGRDQQMISPDKLTYFLGMADGFFERLHHLMGFEEAVIAIAEEPETVAWFIPLILTLQRLRRNS